MNLHSGDISNGYRIDMQPLEGRVSVWKDKTLLASSENAKVVYETRLPPTVYFPRADVAVKLSAQTDLQTFCPFKGTATYRDILLPGQRLENAVWTYENALPESKSIEGFVGFQRSHYTKIDLGQNTLRDANDGNISGPLVDWLLRGASTLPTPEEFTRHLAEKMLDHGIAISRLSALVWSLHPLIAGKHYIWEKGKDEISSFAPTYEIHDHPTYQNSPLRHVSNGMGGVRQRITDDGGENSFPIIADLRAKGATDYVAMPLPFSDGRINVLTLTSDHPDGFTTENLGLVFECVAVIGRYYEVFAQRENAQSLLETYVGKRSGARVLGGEIRRGDGDEIDAAIMFCDLRGSTLLEERLGRAEYIKLLNQFFETVSEQVEQRGGEVLKFIGDAVLAVFPVGTDKTAAQENGLSAATAIVRTLQPPDGAPGGHDIECAIGMSFGAVTYGNVGSLERLDFTVIGHAANVAARLGDHGKQSHHQIVVAENMIVPGTEAVPLGELTLHNISRPVLAYAIAPETVPVTHQTD